MYKWTNDFLVIKQRVGKYIMKKKKKKKKEKTQIWRERTIRRKREKKKDEWRRRQLEKISLKSKIYVLMCIIIGIN